VPSRKRNRDSPLHAEGIPGALTVVPGPAGLKSRFGRLPRSGLTIRQVPVLGMGTKWLSRNRRLVQACLSITDEPHADESDEELEEDDLDALGLKALPVHVDVIRADPADRARVGGLRHPAHPCRKLTHCPSTPRRS
jgi:hypothetical protein